MHRLANTISAKFASVTAPCLRIIAPFRAVPMALPCLPTTPRRELSSSSHEANGQDQCHQASTSLPGTGLAVATSLSRAYKLRKTAQIVQLRKHKDLVCMNLMCERVGEACPCRLSLSMERMEKVTSLDISHNSLPVFPEALFDLETLEALLLSGNRIPKFPDGVRKLQRLRVLTLDDNALESLPVEALLDLPSLMVISAVGNPSIPDTEKQAIREHMLKRGGRAYF